MVGLLVRDEERAPTVQMKTGRQGMLEEERGSNMVAM